MRRREAEPRRVDGDVAGNGTPAPGAPGPAACSTRVVTEHFRCPEDLADFRLTGRPSAARGYFALGGDVVCFGASAASVARRPSAPLHDALGDTTAEGGVVRLPLDPEEVVTNFRYERYCRPAPGEPVRLLEHATIRHIYYEWLRPFLPVSLRRHLQRVHLRDWKSIAFPRWPVDDTVERLLECLFALSMRAQGRWTVPFIWFWPDGAPAAAVMTHDVENLAGRKFCSGLMDLDDAAGIKSSFQLVPEERYPIPETLVDEIRARGFELNIHDLDHNGRLFSDRRNFMRWAERINDYGETYGARGFRSGGLYRNQEWFEALRFAYDMSIPSTAHLEPQRGGCCSVMPFFIGQVLELPLTTTQDYSLFHILNDYSIELWREQLGIITARHGLATFIVHPDYILEARARRTYGTLLEHLVRLRETERLWIALPQEVDRWWRARSRLRLVPDGARWRIEGEGAERARVAVATLADDGLSLTVDVPA